MPLKSVDRLQLLCTCLVMDWQEMTEEEWNEKPGPGKWSKKEILGHLIDSAANNHQRFIRGQYEEVPYIIYDPDKWNLHNNYEQLSSQHLILFWGIYNRHLVNVIKAIPEKNYSRLCRTNEPQPVTLQWLIDDYVKHMEHHLRQIKAYEY